MCTLFTHEEWIEKDAFFYPIQFSFDSFFTFFFFSLEIFTMFFDLFDFLFHPHGSCFMYLATLAFHSGLCRIYIY